jgi:hypothetical protein
MVSISTYKAFWDYIKSVVAGIDEVLLVHERADLQMTIKEVNENSVILMAIIPSSDTESASLDDIKEFDSCFLFVIRKSDPKDQTNDDFLTDLGSTQVIMGNVKDKMIELAGDTEHCNIPPAYAHLMHRLVINGMHTDPEYNVVGCNGWSLSFKLKTVGTQNL